MKCFCFFFAKTWSPVIKPGHHERLLQDDQGETIAIHVKGLFAWLRPDRILRMINMQRSARWTDVIDNTGASSLAVCYNFDLGEFREGLDFLKCRPGRSDIPTFVSCGRPWTRISRNNFSGCLQGWLTKV